MRNLMLDIFSVGADEPGDGHLVIKDAHIEALANERLCEDDDWTLSQIVSTCFKTDPQYANATALEGKHRLNRAVNLQSIARQDRSNHWQLDVGFARAVDKRAEVLREARASKGKSGHEV